MEDQSAQIREVRTELVKKNNKEKLKVDTIIIIDDQGEKYHVDLSKLAFGEFICKTAINNILTCPDVFLIDN